MCLLSPKTPFWSCKLSLLNSLVINKLGLQTRKHFPVMESSNLAPPTRTRGMTILDREKFRKTVRIPMLDISDVNINSVLPHLKRLLFKMEHLKPVQSFENGTKKKVLLNPLGIQCINDLPEEVRNLGLTGAHLKLDEFELCYDNWKVEDILKAVLPDYVEGLKSYSRIGHIVHINLKEHLLKYKSLIGEVLMDKVVGCRTVINKSQTIDNTYRNFQIDLVCGLPDYKVEVKENGAFFEFDFSTVYWNPRLATEHERIIKLLNPGDVLYDVFAGVGPFSIPVAKRKCQVYANDLNPDSFQWLQHNAKRNKVVSAIKTFNKDGRDFIIKDIKQDLLKRWSNSDPDGFSYKCHITMNLPAMAAEFLDAFRGLFSNEDIARISHLPLTTKNAYPIVHLYCFAKGDESSKVAQKMVEDNLGFKLTNNLEGVHFVRNVAPNKDMFRISFHLTKEIMFAVKNESTTAISEKREASPDLSNVKRHCIN